MGDSSRKRRPKKIIVSTDSSEEHLTDEVELKNPRFNQGENRRDKLNSKRNPQGPSDDGISNTERPVSYLKTKHVIKPPILDIKTEKTSPAMYVILGIVLLVIIYFVISVSSSPKYEGNVSELAKQTFASHLTKGNGHISSADFAEQITNSFRTQSHNKALSLLVVGSDLGDLKNSIVQFGNALCGNVVYLEGKDSNFKFAKDLMDYAKNSKMNHDNSFVCPIFLINTADIGRENLDMLEQAFDDSQPMIRNSQDINSDDINARQMVFFLLYQSTEPNSSKEKLRQKVSQQWTGRFFQRIRGVIGLKSEADT
jgi:hypothetical protein